MEEFDAAFLNERAALARNRMKLEFGILSHPTHARIGEAYVAAIVESLPELLPPLSGEGSMPLGFVASWIDIMIPW